MKRTKQYLKRITACIIMAVLLLTLFKNLTDVTERKASDEKYAEFFEEEENFDVLFMGTSHVINGIFPMELWHDYGIVSYNFGGHSNMLPTIYWVMELALKYTNPSLMVIDCGVVLETDIKTSTDFSYVHLSFDAFPLSVTKIRAALDLLDDADMEWLIAEGEVTDAQSRTLLSLLWDFSVYHSRWTDLTSDDFLPNNNVEKGAESRVGVAIPDEIPEVASEDKMETDTVAIQYLEKMIESCQKRGIEVLLINLPYPADEADQRAANRVYDIAEEYNVDYINFLTMDVVDYDTDCYDSDSHLNPSGARKVTDYLGKYISEHYDIADHRDNEAYSDWDEDYIVYRDYKVWLIKEQTSLDTYLMLLADKNLDIEMEVYDDQVLENDLYCKLIENIEMDVQDIAVVSYSDSMNLTASLEWWNAGEYSMQNGEIEGDAAEMDLHIIVTDHDSGTVVDEAYFTDEGNSTQIRASL